MEWICSFLVLIIIGGIVGVTIAIGNFKSKQRNRGERIKALCGELSEKIQVWFMVQPCFHCHECEMVLLEVSPNGRSVHYQCISCKKKMRSPAGSPAATGVLQIWQEVTSLNETYKDGAGLFSPGADPVRVNFAAPAAPMPYEQTTRSPIPEAVRSEVWRRDRGKCVQCGSNQNLQFDHIIPVIRGGATTVANLQLLCQPCNGSKGKKI